MSVLIPNPGIWLAPATARQVPSAEQGWFWGPSAPKISGPIVHLWFSRLQEMDLYFHKEGAQYLFGQDILISLECRRLLFESEI